MFHCEFQQLRLRSIISHYQEGNRFIEKREGGRCKWHSRRNVNTGEEGTVDWVTKCTDWYGQRERHCFSLEESDCSAYPSRRS